MVKKHFQPTSETILPVLHLSITRSSFKNNTKIRRTPTPPFKPPKNTNPSSHMFFTMSPTTTLANLLLFLLSFLFPLTTSDSIHELLQSQGLPAGLFPKTVKSYNLDQFGRLQVHLDRPCVAKFENRVYFDSVVKANLSYGGLIGLEGLSQEELFLWLPVKDIIVDDPSSGLILFDIGVAHKQLSLSLFEDPPVCKPQGVIL